MNNKNLLIIVFIILTFSTCKFFEYRAEPIEILIKSDSFTIAWDDSIPEIAGNPYSTTSFNIYYRVHNTSSWTLLENYDYEGSTEYVITADKLEYGSYDFAISSVNSAGYESALHSSMDTTADPICGWYINWIGSN